MTPMRFDTAKLKKIQKALEKQAFVPAPLMQQKISEAQQAGAIPPPPAPPQDPNAPQGQPEPTLNDVMGLLQEGFNAILQNLQQIGQMVQQQSQPAPGMGENGKKLSATERITKLEEMLQQMMGGGQPPMDPAAEQGQPPMDPAAAQGQPPMDPAAAQGQPPQGGGQPPMQ